MTLKSILRRSPLAGYGQAIRNAPRETIFNRPLLLSAFVYALGGLPVSKYIFDRASHRKLSVVSIREWNDMEKLTCL